MSDIQKHFDQVYGSELQTGILIGPVLDPYQDSNVAIVDFGTETGVELISPASDNSPVANHLTNGGGLHHVCYEVDNIFNLVNTLRSNGLFPVSHPKPAILFDGRRVAFMYSRDGGLIELIESPTPTHR